MVHATTNQKHTSVADYALERRCNWEGNQGFRFGRHIWWGDLPYWQLSRSSVELLWLSIIDVQTYVAKKLDGWSIYRKFIVNEQKNKRQKLVLHRPALFSA